MTIFPANNTCWLVHYWQGLYGGLGHLYAPARRTVPMPHLPYALDNGAFSAWKHNNIWDADAFVAHVEYYAFSPIRPLWCVVPDVVMDAALTFARWEHWANRLRSEFNLTLALAVQDGMIPDDIHRLRPAPDVIFVGGSTEWKWETVGVWTQAFPRVHVGRVNTAAQLEICAASGVESCDGTGWFRGDPKQIADLGRFLSRQSGQPTDDIPRVVALSRTLDCSRHQRDPNAPGAAPRRPRWQQRCLALEGAL